MKTLVWFTSDLRVHDNEVLLRAVEHSTWVLPVYCIDEALSQHTDYGFRKTGAVRMTFLLESLKDLHHQLQQLGSGLLVLKGDPRRLIPETAKRFGADKVMTKKEVAFEERQTQEAVERALWKSKCLFETYSTSTLYHATDLPFALKDIPEVFTTFRKKIEKETKVRPELPVPTSVKSPELPVFSLPTLEELGFESVSEDPRSVYHFRGGETAGELRLQEYLYETKAISTYKDTRNGMCEVNDSSRFSAWLSLGCLSPRRIYWEIKRYEETYEANESTYWLVFELIWRDYFRFMMKKHGSKYFAQTGLKPELRTLYTHQPKAFAFWMNGETGNDFVDANMLELKYTGYMSNRGRQNVASYLCHHLKSDWRYGAAYFESMLIDYDVCSNWGNWAYLAGVGNDPRGLRVFDPDKQAEQYDKTKRYRTTWLSPQASRRAKQTGEWN